VVGTSPDRKIFRIRPVEAVLDGRAAPARDGYRFSAKKTSKTYQDPAGPYNK
jgi:hypothetical protein